MSFFGKVGGAIKKGVHDIGGLAEKAAPFVGMIPGVGTLAGGAIGAAGALAHGDGLKGALKSGAMGAMSGYGGGLAKGMSSASGGGSFLSKVGGMLKGGAEQVAGNFKKPDGSIDFSKLISAGSAGAGLYGQAKQRKSATKYNNAQIDQKNQLMSKILAPQNYNLPQITPAESPGGY